MLSCPTFDKFGGFSFSFFGFKEYRKDYLLFLLFSFIVFVMNYLQILLMVYAFTAQIKLNNFFLLIFKVDHAFKNWSN